MGKESFRFIHAADFHLERPLQDLLDIPDHLRNILIDAPWKAAEAVFEHAMLENVDFVLLTGDLVNPVSSGAAGPAFLLEQFERLQEKGIQVYWAGGVVDDPDRWPEAVLLPPNVHLFSKRQVEPVIHRRNGNIIAVILGRSNDGRESIRAAEYGHEPDDQFVIAVGHGVADTESLTSERIDYWALGGEHNRESLQNEAPPIRYCGSPQGRCLKEHGSHGFYLVDVDVQRNIQVHTTDVDLVRYSQQTIDAEDMALGRDLRQLLSKRIGKLQSECQGRHLLVRWQIQMDLEQSSLVGPSALEEVMSWMRREFGHGQPCLWSTEIEIVPPKQLPKKWQEEDTILGDFLRTSQNHRKSHGKEMNIKPMIDTETPASSVWQTTLLSTDGPTQSALLERATLLGVDMLRGHQVDLLAPTRRFGGLQTKT